MSTVLISSGQISSGQNSSAARRRRSTLLGAFGAVVGVLLAGCGSGPAQASSAAIVGDVSIPLERVQNQIDVVLKKEPAAQEYQRQRTLDAQVSQPIVTLAVQHELIAAAAKREGITVDENAVTQVVDSLGGAELASQRTVNDPATFRQRVRDQLMEIELGRKYADKLEVTFDYFLTKDSQDAITKAKLVAADPAKMEQFVKDSSQSAAGGQAELKAKITSAASPQIAQTMLFGVKPGTVVAFPPSPDNARWMVAYVRDRKTDAKPSGDSSVSQLTPDVLLGIGQRVIQPLAEEIQVKVNPRYGVWDMTLMKVVPAKEAGTAGFQATARTKSAA